MKPSTLLKIFTYLVLVFILFFLPLIWLGVASATTTSILINEIQPAPSSGSEWIEVLNTGQTVISLQGWKLYDQLSSPSLLYEFGAVNLNPGEMLVVEVGSKLNNGGDGVDLKNAIGEVVDSISYTNAPAGQSWSRYVGTTEFAWLNPTRGVTNSAAPPPSPAPTVQPTPTPTPITSPTPAPTPSPNPTASPTPTPAILPALVVSEIMACPATGESEWLEIFNPSSQAVTVQNWKLSDASGNVKTLSGTLLPLQFTVLGWSGSLLNNAGDTFKLMSDTGVLVSQGELDACSAGESWVWSGSNWQISNNPTPGSGISTIESDDSSTEGSSLNTESESLSREASFEPTTAGGSAEIKLGKSFPLSNVELMAWAPRLKEPEGPTILPHPSPEAPSSHSTTHTTWSLIWSWSGILGGGLIILTSTTYLLWQQHIRQLQQQQQQQQQPPKSQVGLSPFKWELG